jgi:hypothetical protein
VTLGVASDASVDDTLVAALPAAAFETLQATTGATVTAFTTRGAVTASSLRGKPGALVVSRVTRPGGLTVAVGPTAASDPTTGTTDGSDTEQPDDGLPNGV